MIIKLNEDIQVEEELTESYERLEDMGLTEFGFRPSRNQFFNDLKQWIKHDQRTLIIGDSGWGKSQMVKQVADSLGYKFKDLRLGKLVPEDLAGLPISKEDAKKRRVTGYSSYDWVLEAADEFELTGTPTVVFFDELNHATEGVLGGSYDAILDKKITNHYLGDAIRVVAAMNYSEEASFSTPLPKPLIQRFDILVMVEKNWGNAIEYLINKFPQHADFLQQNIHLFDEIQNPRNVERILNQIDLGFSPEVMRLMDGQLQQKVKQYVTKLNSEDFIDNGSDLQAQAELIKKVVSAVKSGVLNIINPDTNKKKLTPLNNVTEDGSDDDAANFLQAAKALKIDDMEILDAAREELKLPESVLDNYQI